MSVVSPAALVGTLPRLQSRPYACIWTLHASLQRTRRSHPDQRTSLCESLLEFLGFAAGALDTLERQAPSGAGFVE